MALPNDDDRFNAACDAADAGLAVVFLRERQKRPIHNAWASQPRYTADEIERKWQPGINFGIRLGSRSEPADGLYVHGIDVDVQKIADPKLAARARDEAYAALAKRFPDYKTFPSVKSGSGGESRHFYALCPKVFRKVNIARADWKVDVLDADGKVVGQKPAWEIDWYGDGAQMVLPPSIHPNGRPYEWDGEPADWPNMPEVRPSDIEALFERKPAKRDRVNANPEPLDELDRILFDTEFYDNSGGGMHYDDWRDVIFAVKTEYAGTELYDEAIDLVEEWSRQSNKFSQPRFDEVWEHADPDRDGGITLGSLKKNAGKEFRERERGIILGEMSDERSEDEKTNPEVAERLEKARQWQRELNLNDSGEITNTPHNVKTIVANDEIITKHLVYSISHQGPVWQKVDGKLSPELDDLRFEKNALTQLYRFQTDHLIVGTRLNKSYLIAKPTKADINDSVTLTSQRRKIHPMLDHFTSAKWDGIHRREYLLIDYLGAADNAYSRGVSKGFIDGMMARIVSPGTKFDHMLILEGVQGIGKDQFFSILVGDDYYCDSVSDLSEPKEYIHPTRGKALVHLSELASMRKHDHEVMKQFITKTKDEGRLAYGADNTVVKRTWVCVGSTNAKRYLSDSTGDRRYLPVECGDPEFDPVTGKPSAYNKMFEELRRDRLQIFAEAYHYYCEREDREGDIHEVVIDAEILPEAKRMQSKKAIEPPYVDYIARLGDVLDQPEDMVDLVRKCSPSEERLKGIRNRLSIRDALKMIGETNVRSHDPRTHVMRDALQRLKGWTESEKKVKYALDGISQTVWTREGTDGTPEPIDEFAPAKRRRLIY